MLEHSESKVGKTNTHDDVGILYFQCKLILDNREELNRLSVVWRSILDCDLRRESLGRSNHFKESVRKNIEMEDIERDFEFIVCGWKSNFDMQLFHISQKDEDSMAKRSFNCDNIVFVPN